MPEEAQSGQGRRRNDTGNLDRREIVERQAQTGHDGQNEKGVGPGLAGQRQIPYRTGRQTFNAKRI